MRFRRLQLKLSGFVWLPQEDASNGGTYTVQYTRYTGELSGCYAFALGSLEVGPCVLTRLEDVVGSGRGPNVHPESSHAPWVALGLAARARWSLASWAAVFASPSLAFATSQTTFVIDGVAAQYRVPLAALALELGCEWIL
jgi:hypothetical protein